MSPVKSKLVTSILSISIIALMFVVGGGIIKKINMENDPINVAICKCDTCKCSPCKCDSCKCNQCKCDPCKCDTCKCAQCKCK